MMVPFKPLAAWNCAGSEADSNNLKNVREAIYPSTGGLVDTLIKKVTKAGLGGSRWFHCQLTNEMSISIQTLLLMIHGV